MYRVEIDGFDTFDAARAYADGAPDGHPARVVQVYDADAEPVRWTALANADVRAGNVLLKTSDTPDWDAGGESEQVISGNGFVAATVSLPISDTAFGLSRHNPTHDYRNLLRGWYLAANGTAYVFEDGAQIDGGWNRQYNLGDVFAVAVTGGVATFSRNGEVLHTSEHALAAGDLHFDGLIYQHAGTISGAVIKAG